MTENLNMTWPVGLLVVAVVLAIIDAIQRTRSLHKEIRVLPSDSHGGIVVHTMPIKVTEDQRGDGD